MAYVQHNWQDGELITQDSLNDMENGIFKNSNSNVISVDNYEREAIENTDDGMLQRIFDSALDNSVIVFQNKKEYIVTTGILIKDKTNLKVIGNNSKVSFSGDNDNVFAFQYSGSVDKLDISGFTISGLNTNGKKTAFGGLSGNNLTNSMIHHLIIDSVNVGISLNADLGGTVTNNKVYENKIFSPVGMDAGQGYGIHSAYGNNTEIYNNYIEKAERHSIYIAKGSNIKIYNNVIKNHRSTVATGQYRPALNIARDAVNITIENNIFDSVSDCAIQIGNQNESGDMRNIYVNDNLFINWKTLPALRVGSDTPTVDPYNAYNIYVTNNSFVADSTFSSIVINKGLGVIVSGNKIKQLNPPIRVDAILVNPDIVNALNDVLIVNNVFQVEGGEGKSEFRSITFVGLALTGMPRIQARNNEFIGIYSDTNKEYFDYFIGVASSNPNLVYKTDRLLNKTDAAPSTGYHEEGEIAYNSVPHRDKNVGWVCTATGSPGIWVAFGTF